MTDDKDFSLWLAKEKRAFADAGYQENAASFNTIRSRFGLLLPVSVTLAATFLAGAFSQREYSLLCGFLAFGFGIAGVLCVAGLCATALISKNVGPDTVDGILDDVPKRDEAHATLWMAYTASFINAENIKTIEKNRRWLKAIWISLCLTPFISFFLAFACDVWSSF